MRKKHQNTQLDTILPMFIGLVVLSFMLARVFYFYVTQDATRIGIMPDDAFYYIQLAQHRLKDGIWTFDGQTPATGFHLLYGYFLFFLFAVCNPISWVKVYLIVSVFASVFIALAAYFSVKTTNSLFGLQGSLWAAIPFLSIAVLTQSTMMMESWLVIFFSALAIYNVVLKQPLTVFTQLKLVSIGLLGSLSRSDFGLFSGLVFLTCLLSFKLWNHQEVKRSFLILSGTLLGVGIVLLHTYEIAGHFTQESAQVKLYWSSLQGHSIHASWQLLKSIIIPFGFDLTISNKKWFIIGLALSLLLFSSFRMIKDNLCAYLIGLAALGTLCGYTLLYCYNCAALDIWYAANYISPLCIVLAALGALLYKHISSLPIISPMRMVPIVLVAFVYLNVAFKHLFFIYWPHQAGMMFAGLSLQQMKTEARFAAWNAGIISYFSKLPIINLDGLVNDEVFSYMKKDRLSQYIKMKHINYLVDYEFMLKNSDNQRREGFSDKKLLNCLTPLKAMDGSAPEWPPLPWEPSKLKLFRVTLGCLS